MRSDFPGITVTLQLYFIGAKPLVAFFLTTWGAAFFLVDKMEARLDLGHEVAIVELDRNRLGDGNSEGAK